MVLIDMEMPKCCEDCYIGFIKQVGCKDIVINNHESWAKRHPDCPLKEIQRPHGRLIDADELYLDIQTDEEMRLGEHLKWVKERFDNAPTILEAESEMRE